MYLYIQCVMEKKRYKMSHLPESGKLNTFVSMKLCKKMFVFEIFDENVYCDTALAT